MLHCAWRAVKRPDIRLLLLGIFVLAIYPWSGWWLHKLWWDDRVVPFEVVKAHERFGDVAWPAMPGIGCGLIVLALIRFTHERRKAGKFLP